MAFLREEITVDYLNNGGATVLSGLLDVKMLTLEERKITSPMEVSHLILQSMDFCMPQVLYHWQIQAAAMLRLPTFPVVPRVLQQLN